MAIRLQESMTLPVSERIDVIREFGSETGCGRRTFTVLVANKHQRRKWQWALAKFGIKATAVPGSDIDHKPDCGYSPRTIAYSCWGRLTDLDRLETVTVDGRTLLVTQVSCGELRIPRGMSHVGAGKQGKGKNTLTADAAERSARSMADYAGAAEETKENAREEHAESAEFAKVPRIYSYFPPNERQG